jgi:hypothetical protein
MPQLASRLSVDYPFQNEMIVSDSYSLRVHAPGVAHGVDLSIDRGPWRPCRKALGYWWLDWYDYSDGEHEVVARARLPDGNVEVSEPHEFLVDFGA